MSKTRACAEYESDLIGAASGEADAAASRRLEKHLRACEPCRDEHARYSALDAAVTGLRVTAVVADASARERVLERVADLRSRLVRYAVFPTPLGSVLLAMTDEGISLVEYVARRDGSDSWLLGRRRLELESDRAALEPFHAELVDYLHGRRTMLTWRLDFRFARSEFQRRVLEATAAIPYGAVSSYSGIASDIGRPGAVRAVAGALRRNPVPIVVPCHRIVGSNGAMVGYSGTRVGLKERLLGIEGVHLAHTRRETEIDRSAMYAWYRRDRAFCLPSCGAIGEQPIGAVTLFASMSQAIAVGLSPCSDCRPDLHPLGRR